MKQNIDWKIALPETAKMAGESNAQWFKRFAKKYKLSEAYVKKHYYKHHNQRDIQQYKVENITTDKKEGKFSWREVTEPLQKLQTIFKGAKSSQDFAKFSIKTKEPICVVVLGDLHLGSWATDYNLFKQITDELVNTPNLYAILVGDLAQMSIKLRGVLEVSDNALPPKFQMMFLDDWLQEVKHKVICSTWDNHSVMREEVAVGYSKYAEIFSRHVIYHDNIGHTDIEVNGNVYKVAAAHFFRGRSELNPLHAHFKYMRFTGQDRDIVVAGDSHVPGMAEARISGRRRVAINCGSIQNGGYGKRFFSILNSPDFPCFQLSPNEYSVTPFWSVQEWLNAKK